MSFEITHQGQRAGAIRKNVAGQKIQVFMFDDNGPMTGIAASIGLGFSLDGGTPQNNLGGDFTPEEVDATDLPGWYEWSPVASETNGEVMVLYCQRASGGTNARAASAILYTVNDFEGDLLGSGFTSLTDSLTALRAAMAASILPVTKDD